MFIDDDAVWESEYTLVKPHASKTAKWWKHFKLFDCVEHPHMHNYAHCIINPCTACVKIDSVTGGLIGHMKHKNCDQFNALMGIGLANQASPIVVSSNKGVFVSQHLSDLRDEYKPKTIHQFFLNKQLYTSVQYLKPRQLGMLLTKLHHLLLLTSIRSVLYLGPSMLMQRRSLQAQTVRPSVRECISMA